MVKEIIDVELVSSKELELESDDRLIWLISGFREWITIIVDYLMVKKLI